MHRSRSVTRSGRWVTLALAAMLLGLDSVVLPVEAGSRAEAISAAGLIIDTGAGEPGYVVVTFEESSMTAVDLLRAADLDVVAVDFGGLGEGVCSIVRVGCDVSACRQRLCQSGDPESPFWQYWEQGDDGVWALSPRGASHAQVENGGVAAWVWTGVDPELEPIDWDELASRAGAPNSIVAQEISGEPAVYTTGIAEGDTEGGESPVQTLVALGVVALVGLAGAAIVLRQRGNGRART